MNSRYGYRAEYRAAAGVINSIQTSILTKMRIGWREDHSTLEWPLAINGPQWVHSGISSGTNQARKAILASFAAGGKIWFREQEGSTSQVAVNPKDVKEEMIKRYVAITGEKSSENPNSFEGLFEWGHKAYPNASLPTVHMEYKGDFILTDKFDSKAMKPVTLDKPLISPWKKNRSLQIQFFGFS